MFISTPINPTDQESLEESLLDLIKATHESHQGRLYRDLSGLAETVSYLTHTFCRFEGKYSVTNLTPSDFTRVLEADDLSHPHITLQWPGFRAHDFVNSGMNHPEKLELFRTIFAPIHLLFEGAEGASNIRLLHSSLTKH